MLTQPDHSKLHPSISAHHHSDLVVIHTMMGKKLMGRWEMKGVNGMTLGFAQ